MYFASGALVLHMHTSNFAHGELSPGTIHYFLSNQAAVYTNALAHKGAVTCRTSPFVHLANKDNTCL